MKKEPSHRNPFDYTNPVRDLSAYIGRSELLHQLGSWNESNTRISITGPRRMGTTSTLNVILAEAQRKRRNCIYLDLRSLHRPITTEAVASAIFSGLGYKTTGQIDEIERIIDSLKNSIPAFTLAIDEFDLVQSEKAHSLLAFLTMVLPLEIASFKRGEHHSLHDLAVIIGSRQSLFDIERATRCIDSPWYHNYKTFNLRPLTRKDAMRLISLPSSGAGRPLEADGAWLIRLAGTWPFFLKLACHHAFQRKQSGVTNRLDKRSREAVEERVWEEALPQLESYWTFLSSRQRDLLANLPTWRKSGAEGRFDPDIMRLTRDGVVSIAGGRVDYTCTLFSSYFTKKPYYEEALVGHSTPPPEFALASIADCLSRLGACTAELSSWDDSKEVNIQEIAYVVLRSQYQRVSRERPAGRGPLRNYRCDLHVEDVDVLIEIKRVRSPSHVPRLQAEINDDIVGYRHNKPKQRLVFLIWDRERYVGDPEYFSDTYQKKDPNVRIVFVP